MATRAGTPGAVLTQREGGAQASGQVIVGLEAPSEVGFEAPSFVGTCDDVYAIFDKKDEDEFMNMSSSSF